MKLREKVSGDGIGEEFGMGNGADLCLVSLPSPHRGEEDRHQGGEVDDVDGRAERLAEDLW